MKTNIIYLVPAAILALGIQGASAACYADYKAKQDDPLRLHYGVIEVSGGSCDSKSAAKSEISRKIDRDGWTLLSVIGIFDKDGLQTRRSRAGTYYLKY